jgi:urea transport system permease protein
MRTIGLLLCGWLLSVSCAGGDRPGAAQAAGLRRLRHQDRGDHGAGAGGAAEALPVLKALADDSLAVAGERVVIVDGERVLDAASNTEITPAPAARETIGINNRVRRELSAALAALRLFSSERAVRWQAAQEVTLSADAKMLPLLDKALAAETDPEIRTRLQLAHAQASLGSTDAGVRLAPCARSARAATPRFASLLMPLTEKRGDNWVEPDSAVRAAAGTSIRSIEQRLAWADNLGRAFTGLSLGSILLLAALGLAITYGVMGVINMAHGELLMVGAYSAWAMQSVFRAYLPGRSTGICWPRSRSAFSPRRWSACSWSGSSSATSMAGRWKRCSPPGASRCS